MGFAEDGKQEQGSLMNYRPMNYACEKNRLMIKVNYFPTPKVRSEFLGHVISELTIPLVCEKN